MSQEQKYSIGIESHPFVAHPQDAMRATHVTASMEYLNLVPEKDEGQTGNMDARVTAVNDKPKWSLIPYRWCLAMVGCGPRRDERGQSFLSHVITQGKLVLSQAPKIIQTHRDAIRRLIDDAGDATYCDFAIVGGTNYTAAEPHPFAEEMHTLLCETVLAETYATVRPLVIDKDANDICPRSFEKNLLVKMSDLQRKCVIHLFEPQSHAGFVKPQLRARRFGT
jgi:hypothetical protein